MSKTKLKLAATPTPQNLDQANDAIFRIGDYDRQIAFLDIGLKDALAKVKESFEKQSQPLAKLREMEVSGVVTWCEAHRAFLTQNGKIKTASFPAGKVSWRLRPPSCKLPREQSGMITWLKDHGLNRFIRVIEEVSKEALLAEPEAASNIPGVKIGSEGEDIIVEPFTPQGLEAAS